jgi:hypothetical protein
MNRKLVAMLALSLAATPALADLKLAQDSGCTACHAIDKKLAGPSYKDIAVKYSNYSATHSVPGIQGRPMNTERRTSRTRWPCLRAVEM